jgi:GxxExxY protein
MSILLHIPVETEELSKRIVGVAIEVHRHLGPGFLEHVYSEALAYELRLNEIPFEREKIVHVTYKGADIAEHRLDFLINKQLIVELKTVNCFLPIHTAQLLSYLKATGLSLGLLINFHVTKLSTGVKRVILTNNY